MDREEKLREILHTEEKIIPKNENTYKPCKTLMQEDYEKIKNKMDKENKYEVMNSEDCQYLRNNKLGIYCGEGTRKVRKFKKNGKDLIVCLHCYENRYNLIEVSKEEFEILENK